MGLDSATKSKFKNILNREKINQYFSQYKLGDFYCVIDENKKGKINN